MLDIDPKNSSAMSVIAADKTGGTRRYQRRPTNFDEATAQKDDLGIDLYKLQILEKSQDLQQAGNTLLRKLAELYPAEPTFRKELVKPLYVFQHRADDALKEQRAIIAGAAKGPGRRNGSGPPA